MKSAGVSAPGATRRADEAGARKKPLLAKGEKRLLKKRHVAETRAARSAKDTGSAGGRQGGAREALRKTEYAHGPKRGPRPRRGASPASSSRDFKTTATTNAWRPPTGASAARRKRGRSRRSRGASLAYVSPRFRVGPTRTAWRWWSIWSIRSRRSDDSRRSRRLQKKRTTRSWRATPRAPPRSPRRCPLARRS